MYLATLLFVEWLADHVESVGLYFMEWNVFGALPIIVLDSDKVDWSVLLYKTTERMLKAAFTSQPRSIPHLLSFRISFHPTKHYNPYDLFPPIMIMMKTQQPKLYVIDSKTVDPQ
ncbi:hypothetical protein BDEG_25471 [Batrachochytrium dendrobatidis JEL423]|uniref:Uncharacterized protein n=1 Tax=Batrachochytrium dendrobatidis (strain JEL423) TaxID=403673 RepID=A0A177WPA8_BATDL|nr:hypothetical protein BDEG_25471 [Batrachochytrium dendrobatidis JEL423]